MAYAVKNTDKYDDEIFEIVLHIATASGDRKTALDYLDEIQERTMMLAEFPESGSLPRNATLRKQGYRVLVVAKQCNTQKAGIQSSCSGKTPLGFL